MIATHDCNAACRLMRRWLANLGTTTQASARLPLHTRADTTENIVGAFSRRAVRVCRYGYAYPCQAAGGGLADASVCALKPTDFRGAPCSDAAGAQKEYSELMRCARPLACFSQSAPRGK
jgi:hypothetical protein